MFLFLRKNEPIKIVPTPKLAIRIKEERFDVVEGHSWEVVIPAGIVEISFDVESTFCQLFNSTFFKAFPTSN